MINLVLRQTQTDLLCRLLHTQLISKDRLKPKLRSIRSGENRWQKNPQIP